MEAKRIQEKQTKKTIIHIRRVLRKNFAYHSKFEIQVKNEANPKPDQWSAKKFRKLQSVAWKGTNHPIFNEFYVC